MRVLADWSRCSETRMGRFGRWIGTDVVESWCSCVSQYTVSFYWRVCAEPQNNLSGQRVMSWSLDTGVSRILTSQFVNPNLLCLLCYRSTHTHTHSLTHSHTHTQTHTHTHIHRYLLIHSGKQVSFQPKILGAWVLIWSKSHNENPESVQHCHTKCNGSDALAPAISASVCV